MVDALRRIHHSLRPSGVLLDLHPQPEPEAVEVWCGETRDLIGHVVDEQDMSDVTQAESRMDLMERDGWFTAETRRTFDLLTHFPSVDEWFAYRSDNDYSGVVPEDVESMARRLLAERDCELVTREPIRASLLKWLPGPN